MLFSLHFINLDMLGFLKFQFKIFYMVPCDFFFDPWFIYMCVA